MRDFLVNISINVHSKGARIPHYYLKLFLLKIILYLLYLMLSLFYIFLLLGGVTTYIIDYFLDLALTPRE